MWNKVGSGSYRGVDLVESLNHKNYHNFYRKSYRLPASHYPKVGNGPREGPDHTIQGRETNEVGNYRNDGPATMATVVNNNGESDRNVDK